ncbi:TerB family tellurite resistance protein [Stieleria mannarensis]|uniref:tellurite resistance TerB family protein n=1 Tax=Stieleria mannarensis TaxID=2755585 RepID=UPI001603195A|nr:TerB family tellurite resistance protein [Rhodopirellula sp. JC639]
MPHLNQLKSELLSDGVISPNEVARIRRHIEQDGALDFDDVAFLVEVLGEASEVCPEFDELFLPLMRHVLLKDGKIDLDEQAVLVDMLTAGESIRPSELKLLRDLQIEATETTPGFEKLCQAVMAIPAN